MKDFTIKTLGGEVTLKFPTSVEDIKESYILSAVQHIKPANDYSVVGLISHDNLSTLVLSVQKKNKGFSTGCIPIFVTGGATESEYHKNIPLGSKLVIDSSDLMRGHHLVVPHNVLSMDYFLRTISIAKDTNLYQNAVKFGQEVYFIDFKLIPNTDIKAYYTFSDEGKENFEREADIYVASLNKSCISSTGGEK